MAHPLVDQLRFTREEWKRGLETVTPEDAIRRFEPMNCISWMIGHLATQEQHYWVEQAQGKAPIVEGLYDLVGSGRPASTPPLDEMWQAWQTITAAADPFLDTLDSQTLQTHMTYKGKTVHESIGTMLYRNIYHYWYHLGEAMAVRQQLGQIGLPQFVGRITDSAYRPESD